MYLLNVECRHIKTLTFFITMPTHLHPITVSTVCAVLP